MTAESTNGDWDAALADLLTDDDTSATLVDSADLPSGGWQSRPAQRAPIIPPWLRSRAAFTDTMAWAAKYAAHTTGYHTVRTPLYLGKLALYTPVGVGRAVRGGWRWVLDREGHQLRLGAVHQNDPAEYRKLSMQRDSRVRFRAWLAGIGALVVSCAGGVGWASLTDGEQTLATIAGGFVAVVVFGLVGRPGDRPIAGTAIVSSQVARLDSDSIVHALSVLGLAAITARLAKNPQAIRFPAPIVRDGEGWRATIDLPGGATAEQVIERRLALASGLARPVGCVWPEAEPSVHPGRLILWVGDREMAATKPAPWPLVKAGAVDLFRPFPFGTDPRGRQVGVTLMFASAAIGAIPRMGKTFALRLMLLAAALDPRAELHPYDLKGTGDFGALQPVAHRYRSGDDDDDIAYALADMRDLQAELRRRAKVIRELPRELCPESKVTPELASLPAYRLHPVMVAVDECQRWFEHPEHGDELTAICEDLVRRGPALGITAVFATQRVDAKSLPTGISSNAVLRFCLKVMGHVANDMVLGTGSYKAGIQATMFARSDRGIGYLAGEGDDPQIVRTYYLDGPAAEQVVARARAAREAAGTVTGHALDPAASSERPRDEHRVLDDVLAVVPATEPKVWCETLAERLADHRPDAYAGWTGEQVTKALGRYGIKTVQVFRNGQNRRGIERTAIANAITQRDRFQGGKPVD
ncbi:S-DNA-T family DNA segregation ATPase FtsK/SpoIIIE [Allocatelliglobosispora scoriae]|uniref:S-DNA-T family DNA segregation ATPase FtsK/SpoIIIE n=1 Tax=Allocatelliglobosispora scoriae TaxID=643052 RepID=A0A841BWV8_9ACTN|nr:cell division protein FtsK [Allocatelliglobosispora scoriae]MBB5871978.1 S-DNA-T family DNA segregation ATPase FtsK/SpoIIIE [Allocatelliglobosispora scoriae]